MSIQRVIEIPLEEVQTEAGNKHQGDPSKCFLCGKKLGKSPKYVHLLTNGNIVSWPGHDIAESQGFFPVGSECAKKLIIQFAF